MISALLIALTAFPAAPPAACPVVIEDVDDVTITGRLEAREGWVALLPDRSFCIELTETPTPYGGVRRDRVLDVYLAGGPEGYDLPLGERVRVTGFVAGAHTEEHNADLLIVVTEEAGVAKIGRDGGGATVQIEEPR